MLELFIEAEPAMLGRRYILVTVIRLLLAAMCWFDHRPLWAYLGALYPVPWEVTRVAGLLLANPLLLAEPQNMLPIIDIGLQAAQCGFLIGLGLQAWRLWRPAPASPARDDRLAQPLDGARLRRPRWVWSLGMVGATVASAYIVCWLGHILARQMIGTPFNRAPVQIPVLSETIDALGFWPAGFALAFGAIATWQAQGFSLGARASAAEQFGTKSLPDSHPLTQRVHAMAAQIGLPPPEVGLMNVMNAFAVGSDPKNALVVIGVPLARKLSPEELDAVIGHELGHIATHDVHRMQVAEGYQRLLGNVFAGVVRVGVNATAKTRSGMQAGRLLGHLGRLFLGFLSELMVKGLSRSREYSADAIGAALTSRDAMANALRKIHDAPATPTSAENEYAYLMFRGLRFGNVLGTHPTLERRLAALERGQTLRRLPRKAAGQPSVRPYGEAGAA